MNKLSKREQLATVAQSVEQLIRNQQVAGSSPASSSKKQEYLNGIPVFYIRNKNRLNLLIKRKGSKRFLFSWCWDRASRIAFRRKYPALSSPVRPLVRSPRPVLVSRRGTLNG